MINSLFMLGSSYNKDRKISLAFIIGWIVYMIIGSDLALGAIFPVINVTVFLSLSIIINLINNKKINTILSISSILIWSIIIDIICYYMYPMMSMGQNLFEYVGQGILFNYKYIFSNIIAICCINVVEMVLNKLSVVIRDKIRAVA